MGRISAIDVLARHLVLSSVGVALLFVLPNGAFGNDVILPFLGSSGGITPAHLAGLAVILLAWGCFALRVAARSSTWRGDPLSWTFAGLGLGGGAGIIAAGLFDAPTPLIAAATLTVAAHLLLALRLEHLAGSSRASLTLNAPAVTRA